MVVEMNTPKFLVGQTVYVVGKPGVEFGKRVKVLTQVPGIGYVVASDAVAGLLIEPDYLTGKVLDIAA
jgi:hypothetical protein